MNAFRDDLRQLVARHLSLVPSPRLVKIVEAMTGFEAGPPSGLQGVPRYTNIVHGGEHIATYDSDTDLAWSAAPLPCGDVRWKQATKEAKDCGLLGLDGWRLPTIKELLSIIDYGRFNPAVDANHFKGPFDWHWSSTPDASAPSDYAWYVYLSYGNAHRYDQAFHGQVRAVRAGQPLALGI